MVPQLCEYTKNYEFYILKEYIFWYITFIKIKW